MPIDLQFIVTEILKLTLAEPEEIQADAGGLGLGPEYAGFLDRNNMVVAIAQKFQPAWRRFTLAHEIGHWMLHPGLVYMREHPLMGGERSDKNRPVQEQEADLFAAELLMPSKYLTRVFQDTFGGRVDGRTPSDALAYSLSVGTNQTISPRDLISRGIRYRSLLIAETNFYDQRQFCPLAEHFRVSPTAMAIQLEDLGLVK